MKKNQNINLWIILIIIVLAIFVFKPQQDIKLSTFEDWDNALTNCSVVDIIIEEGGDYNCGNSGCSKSEYYCYQTKLQKPTKLLECTYQTIYFPKRSCELKPTDDAIETYIDSNDCQHWNITSSEYRCLKTPSCRAVSDINVCNNMGNNACSNTYCKRNCNSHYENVIVGSNDFGGLTDYTKTRIQVCINELVPVKVYCLNSAKTQCTERQICSTMPFFEYTYSSLSECNANINTTTSLFDIYCLSSDKLKCSVVTAIEEPNCGLNEYKYFLLQHCKDNLQTLPPIIINMTFNETITYNITTNITTITNETIICNGLFIFDNCYNYVYVFGAVLVIFILLILFKPSKI